MSSEHLISSTAATPSEHTVAWVFGQPVTDVPQDLFIPPDALKVVLSSFQGPLDLLLYLIRKQNIDVLDIPMVKITEQYLHYIAQMEAYQFDLAAEYLLMAAMLIEIKSRLLLPRPEEVEDEEALFQLHLIKEKMGVKSKIRLLHYPMTQSPMLLGFRDILIVLPELDYTEEELQLIFQHELTHF